MPSPKNPAPRDEHLQVLDVHVVDILAHLEALLRHSHSIQRALLQLRREAPPPAPAPTGAVLKDLHGHAHEMRRECVMLADIIDDLSTGFENLTTAHDRPSGS